MYMALRYEVILMPKAPVLMTMKDAESKAGWGDYTRSGYTAKGKHLYISVDGKTIPRNPLYAAWKSKTFTDNDLLLHFFLTDLLTENEQGMTAGELCDSIVASYGCVFDSQTIRLKLKEYESLGLLFSEKKGKALYYRLAPDFPCEKGAAAGEADPSHGLWERILTAVKFFQEAAPFGFVGSTILDRSGARNTLFQWKHHFIVHTLEDGILSDALSAIRQKRAVRLENKSSRSGKLTVMEGIPLKIMVSTRTGRRYLCLYQEESRRFNTLRLDCITKVQLLQECPFYEELSLKLKRNLPHCWGRFLREQPQPAGRNMHEALYRRKKRALHPQQAVPGGPGRGSAPDTGK